MIVCVMCLCSVAESVGDSLVLICIHSPDQWESDGMAGLIDSNVVQAMEPFILM